jgi:hypothetical protein
MAAFTGDSKMKSQICPNCCPDGGALFDRISETETECRGCRHVKASARRVTKKSKEFEATLQWLLAL